MEGADEADRTNGKGRIGGKEKMAGAEGADMKGKMDWLWLSYYVMNFTATFRNSMDVLKPEVSFKLRIMQTWSYIGILVSTGLTFFRSLVKKLTFIKLSSSM